MSRLKYAILKLSSEDQEFPGSELLAHSSQNKGWQSARFCDFPQEILLGFDQVVHLRQVQFLSHQSKIATKIELYTALPDADTPGGPSYETARFKRLGYLSLDSNERSNFQARELKSVYVDVTTQFVKVLLHKCHINKYNLVNQVALIAMNCLGDVVGPDLPGDISTPSVPSKIVNATRDSNPLVDEMRFDPYTLERIKAVTAAKNRAIELEDYDEAKKCKEMLNKLRKMGQALKELETKKQQAVINEEYDVAKALKIEIDRIHVSINEGATRLDTQRDAVHQPTDGYRIPPPSGGPVQHSPASQAVPPPSYGFGGGPPPNEVWGHPSPTYGGYHGGPHDVGDEGYVGYSGSPGGGPYGKSGVPPYPPGAPPSVEGGYITAQEYNYGAGSGGGFTPPPGRGNPQGQHGAVGGYIPPPRPQQHDDFPANRNYQAHAPPPLGPVQQDQFPPRGSDQDMYGGGPITPTNENPFPSGPGGGGGPPGGPIYGAPFPANNMMQHQQQLADPSMRGYDVEHGEYSPHTMGGPPGAPGSARGDTYVLPGTNVINSPKHGMMSPGSPARDGGSMIGPGVGVGLGDDPMEQPVGPQPPLRNSIVISAKGEYSTDMTLGEDGGQTARDQAENGGGPQSQYTADNHPLKGIPNTETLADPEPINVSFIKETQPLNDMWGEYIVRCIYSKSWNLREAAYAKIDLELNQKKQPISVEHLRCLMGILKRAASDRIAQVFLTSVQLLHSTLEGIKGLRKSEVQPLFDSFIPLLVERGGDTNARCSTAANDSLLSLAKCQQLGATFASQYLLRPVKKKNVPARVYVNRMKLLNYLVSEFELQPVSPMGIPLEPLMGLAMEWFNNPTAEVRQACVEVVGSVGKKVGVERIERFLQHLRPAQREVFDQELDRIGSPKAKNAGAQDGTQQAGENVEEDEVPFTCQFCGREDPSFTPEGLDIHYWKDCPMLIQCQYCQQVIEIASLREHYLAECEADQITEANQNLPPKTCPLCETGIADETEEIWRQHLLRECVKNPRKT